MGLLPLVLAAPNPAEVLSAYASLYLEQEVQVEGWVRQVGSFARFLEAVSFSHASVMNISNVARESQVERRTVYRSLRPAGPLDRPEEIEGAALEGLVAQHLRAWVAYSDAGFDLFYWRTRSGVEVDFVLYGAEGFWALEVKNSGRVRPEHLRGLESFKADYPESQVMLLYRGTERLKIGNVYCLPVDAFLRELRPSRELT